MAFTDNPDQWELFKAQRPKTAADEIIRWATPITAFQRTALADTELGGVAIKKGQRVVLFYRSANFDEEVFDDPYTFNILRDPNPHLGFGGTGSALLYWRQPRAHDGRPDDQRDRRPHARPGPDGRPPAAALAVHQRHQALAGRLRGPVKIGVPCRTEFAPAALALPQHPVTRARAGFDELALEDLVGRRAGQLGVDPHIPRPRLR